MIKAFTLILIIIFQFTSTAQNAPLTTLGSVSAASPGSIQVPVTVTNFSNIGAIYLSIDYDYSVIQLTGATPHPQLPTFLHGDADLGTGFHRITLGWYGNGLSLADGSAIMTLSFNYSSGNTILTFFDNGPSCEYADGDGNGLNDIPTSDYYYDGLVCAALSNPGPISGESTVCYGQYAVSYSVEPNTEASAYIWNVPEHVSIVCGQNTNLILVNFNDYAESGNIQVYITNPCDMMSSSSILAVTVNQLPVAGAGDNITIPWGTTTTLDAASGGSGSFSYHWSPEELLVNPDVQNPLTVPLYETNVFTLTVTDLATGCQNNDTKLIGISGGPLTINPFAYPDSICYGYLTLLYAFASGGSGNYTYIWDSDPSGWTSFEENPLAEPDVTTTFLLTVDDGYNTVSDSVNVYVDEEVIATISGNDTLCGNGATTALTVELTGTPPWDFIYSFGSQSIIVTGLTTTPYSLVTGNAGDYMISWVRDILLFCPGTGNGTGNVAAYPIPPAPVISLIEMTLVTDACCGNQWYHNDAVIPGATGVSYTATESGKYYDIVTRFSCVSDTSNAITVIIDGINESLQASIEIYPNPARDRLMIGYSEASTGSIDISLHTPDGRTVRRENFHNSSGNAEYTLDLKGVSPGLYILTIETETVVFAGKVIILP